MIRLEVMPEKIRRGKREDNALIGDPPIGLENLTRDLTGQNNTNSSGGLRPAT
jgi:hypothetical protein